MDHKNTDLISLKTWLITRYGEDAPSLGTARKWARENRIIPKPRKQGTRYLVSPNARYSGK